jgi:hypothetical protein
MEIIDLAVIIHICRSRHEEEEEKSRKVNKVIPMLTDGRGRKKLSLEVDAAAGASGAEVD